MALGRLLDTHEPQENAPSGIGEAGTETSNHASDEIDEADFLKGLTENVRDQDDLERDIANQVGLQIQTHWILGMLIVDGSSG